MLYNLDQFVTLIHFLLENESIILSMPINGDLWKIRHLINDCSSTHINTDNEFINYLQQFNQISSQSLQFNKTLDTFHKITLFNMPTLQFINIVNILILKERLSGNSISIDATPKFNKTLEQLLEPSQPQKIEYTHEQLLLLSFQNESSILKTLLNKPTAKTILTKQRAKLKTPIQPFYQVCDDINHNYSLASIALNNKKETYNSKNLQEHLIHKKIQQSKSNLNQEVYKCYCEKIHFLPIINNHTDLTLGDCSYLDTCHKMRNCRYLHYFTLNPLPRQKQQQQVIKSYDYTIDDCFTENFRPILPPQWIECDVRKLPFSTLGKFAAIISDPAWDIHMSLPYSTCKDDELLELPMQELCDEGIIMLWVTGRSIEIGRKALVKWGYKVSDEMIWIKLNQLKRTIVTGRTGHWLNHSKEHLLVGIKGNPIWLNTKIDLDLVISNTRETSRKPDEFYDIVERLVGKHSRKLEIFGRDHNTRPGWLTIGNQLKGVSLYEPEVKLKYNMYINKQK
ncbi:unnamed protein product [Candida verbasci]|uniref:mRNA m(6)A methyltransferase n=1 Tax=Candida verbasci TaxID=1227364 RepID=A0A9W4XFG6_9ASCO|nr:unnamed protein product [Candida verbasci]